MTWLTEDSESNGQAPVSPPVPLLSTCPRSEESQKPSTAPRILDYPDISLPLSFDPRCLQSRQIKH